MPKTFATMAFIPFSCQRLKTIQTPLIFEITPVPSRTSSAEPVRVQEIVS